MIFSALRGAFLLARGRPDGALLVRTDGRAVAVSFGTMVVCLPLYALSIWLAWRFDLPASWPKVPWHEAALAVLRYVIVWVGYALASRQLAIALGRERHWPLFIAVLNWCSLPQQMLMTGGDLLLLVREPNWLGPTCYLVACFWALWLQWFATRLTLGVSRGIAASFVGMNLAIEFLLAAATVTPPR